MSIASFIMALVGPVAVRTVIALGFTAVVFTGVTALANELVESAQTSWSNVSVTVLQLATLSGIPESLGMVFGATLSVFAVRASVGFGRYVFKK